MENEANITYQILHPEESIPDGAISADKKADAKVVSIKTEQGGELIFAEPEELRELSPVLDQFRVHGVAIPDYVFLEYVSRSGDSDYEVSEVEFSDPSASGYKKTVDQLIKAGDNIQLHDFLQTLRTPISAIRCNYKGGKNLHTKLNGSGLITLQGDQKTVTDLTTKVLTQLTTFLSEVYQPL